MNWNEAVEQKREALKRILATLLAMIGASGALPPVVLPRHLHRFVLRLLRPAEAAARRLIIIAARDHMDESGPAAMPKPEPERSTGFQRGASGHAPTTARIARRAISFPLLDPLIRAKNDHRNAKPKPAAPFTFFGLRIPFCRQASVPPPLSPDDPLDAGNLAGRLEAIGRALDDLPAQAKRLARWQARRDAALALEGEVEAEQSRLNSPPPLIPPHKGEGDSEASPDSANLQGLGHGKHAAAPPPPCGEGLGVGVTDRIARRPLRIRSKNRPRTTQRLMQPRRLLGHHRKSSLSEFPTALNTLAIRPRIRLDTS